ncbi:MAG TPA: serine/threonine-protein kinase, partial [Planctomycetota bacterium]|nr:serine/threonine-protein kinase [Planctomycetota bacterium]
MPPDDASTSEPRGLAAFSLGRELGSGSTGTVYLATARRAMRGVKAGETVAVKFLHARLLGDPAARRRFLREARAGLRVKSKHLVRFHHVDETELLGARVLYLVMEWVEGPTLRDLLKDGPLAEPLVRSVCAQVSRGLSALHATGVVHLDVKPENVILAAGGRAVLMDLGFARALDTTGDSDHDDLSTFAGSVAYAAPERLRGLPPTPQTDVYAVGVLLHELATGERPFPGNDLAAVIRGHLEGVAPPPSSRNPRVSAFLDAVVARCLEKSPGDRFAGALELATILERAEGSPFWRERLASRASGPGLRRAHLTAFRGRDEEMRALATEHARAAAGAFRAVVVAGEAGVGKTRLVDEFVVKALEQDDPPLSLYGRSPRVGDPAPAEPFVAMLERYLGVPRGKEPDAAAARRLRALLPASSAVALLDFLKSPSPTAPVGALARAVAAFLEAAAAEQTAVAFLDDADRADPATTECLHAIVAHAPPRCLLVIARRPESSRVDAVLTFARDRGALSEVALPPLDAVAVGEIVDELVEPGAARAALRDALVRSTGGNPGHLAEAIRTLRASGELVASEGATLRVAGNVDSIP